MFKKVHDEVRKLDAVLQRVQHVVDVARLDLRLVFGNLRQCRVGRFAAGVVRRERVLRGSRLEMRARGFQRTARVIERVDVLVHPRPGSIAAVRGERTR